METEPAFTPVQISLDRLTVHFTSVHQCMETGDTVSLSHAFDRVNDPGDSPVIRKVKLRPTEDVVLSVPSEWTSKGCRWVFHHKTAPFTDFDQIVAAKSNVVEVVNSGGEIVTDVPANEICTIVTRGQPLVVKSKNTLCWLLVALYPYQ